MFHGPLAVIELERDPLTLGQFPQLFVSWLREAGWLAGVFLALVLVAGLFRRTGWIARYLPVMGLCGLLALAAFGTALVFYLNEPPSPVVENPNSRDVPIIPLTQQAIYRDRALAVGGGLAFLGLLVPLLADLRRWSFRRILAIARLSFKEALRRRVPWVFAAFVLIFLFPPKWFFPGKPEDEIREAVAVMEPVLHLMMLLAFSFLAAFSIPTDVRTQTIHTVVTKPIERFEIVVGRFIGYVGLATLILLGLRLFALVMIIASNVSPQAEFESYQARDPIFGQLEFRRRGDPDFKGELIGREWEYRKYIAGGDRSSQRAVYQFSQLPARLTNPGDDQLPKGPIPLEFAFDIFRTNKGEEDKGVQTSLYFATAKWSDDKRPEYQNEMKRLRLNPSRVPDPAELPRVPYTQKQLLELTPDAIAKADPELRAALPKWQELARWNDLSQRYGYFELRGKEIADYHTFQVLVPAGLFAAVTPAEGKSDLEVTVKCDSPSQFLGVAKRDLYLVAGNYGFPLNFIKGSFGLWLMLCLVIGLALVFSTFLTGVIAWLATAFIVICGFFPELIQEVGRGKMVGGGPIEQAIRLANNTNQLIPLEETPAKKVGDVFDRGIEWFYRRIAHAFPDVDRFDWSNYVAEGFNIPAGEMLMSFFVLVGYLLPWAVVGYYMMRSREIAS